MKFLKPNRRTALFISKSLVITAIVTTLFLGLSQLKKGGDKIPFLKSFNYEILFLIENIEGIGIVAGLIAFILNFPEQQKKSQYEAWQVIALAKGHSGSGGRIQALQDLAEDGISLAGVSVESAYLSGIKLPEADLIHASFKFSKLSESNLSGADLTGAMLEGADLRTANLRDAILRGANLNNTKLESANLNGSSLRNAYLRSANLLGTDLNNADLNGADLYSANLTDADLKNADLNGADLKNASLYSANLIDADLKNADLENADLRNADLNGAKFGTGISSPKLCSKNGIISISKDWVRAKNITPEQIKQAKNWEKAVYSPEFRKKLGLPPTDS